jgi:hypothetical protein
LATRQANYKKVEKLIVDAGVKHGGDGFTMFGCAITLSMGTSMAAKVAPPVRGWANATIQQEFLAAIPPPVRALAGPGWMRKYLSMLNKLKACAQDVEPPVAKPGCKCVIM